MIIDYLSGTTIFYESIETLLEVMEPCLRTWPLQTPLISDAISNISVGNGIL